MPPSVLLLIVMALMPIITVSHHLANLGKSANAHQRSLKLLEQTVKSLMKSGKLREVNESWVITSGLLGLNIVIDIDEITKRFHNGFAKGTYGELPRIIIQPITCIISNDQKQKACVQSPQTPKNETSLDTFALLLMSMGFACSIENWKTIWDATVDGASPSVRIRTVMINCLGLHTSGISPLIALSLPPEATYEKEKGAIEVKGSGSCFWRISINETHQYQVEVKLPGRNNWRTLDSVRSYTHSVDPIELAHLLFNAPKAMALDSSWDSDEYCYYSYHHELIDAVAIRYYPLRKLLIKRKFRDAKHFTDREGDE